MAIAVPKELGYNTKLNADIFERGIYGFAEAKKNHPYSEKLYISNPSILNHCIEVRLDRVMTDTWRGTDGFLYLERDIIPGDPSLQKSQCNGKGTKLGFSYPDHEYKHGPRQDIGRENAGETIAEPNITDIAASYSVPVISHGSRKRADIKREFGASNYIYNPLPIRKKSKKKYVPVKAKDDAYWAQRVKNNIAARRSREERRRVEIEVVKKCESLMSENCKLRQENGLLLERVQIMESFICAKLGVRY